MKIRMNRELKNLVVELQRGEKLVAEGNCSEAKELLLRGVAAAKRMGLPYAHIAWQLCMAHDGLDEMEDATRMAVEAIDQDPLSPAYRRAFSIASGQLREQLAARSPDDPSIPRVYALLAENDTAEEDSHLMMARHLLTGGDVSGAMRLLQATTTLSPGCAAAWRLLSKLQREQGDEEGAARSHVEVMALETLVGASVQIVSVSRGDRRATFVLPAREDRLDISNLEEMGFRLEAGEVHDWHVVAIASPAGPEDFLEGKLIADFPFLFLRDELEVYESAPASFTTAP